MSYLSKLPNEILIKILEYCKVLRLTLVSKRFNEVISGSSVLMSKIQLVITSNLEILQSERKFQNILIKFNYDIDENAVEIIKKFGVSIKQLEMIRCIVRQDDFIKIIKSLPNLEAITIITTFLKDVAAPAELDVPLMIKKIAFRSSNLKFLKILRTSALKRINCTFPWPQDQEAADFLNAHPNIEEIENLTVGKIDEKLLGHVLGEFQ